LVVSVTAATQDW